MTTGIKESNLSVLSDVSCNSKGKATRKSWSGVDGKYPIPSPYSSKWNSWESTIDEVGVSQRCIQFRCTLPGGGTDTRATGAPTTVWGVFPVLNIPANAQLAALSRILDSAKGHSFNAGVFAAESKMAVDMCVTNLGKLGRSILALKRGDFSTALRQLGTTSQKVSKLKSKDISGRWLEMQYGWLPLLSDCFQAAKAVEAISKGPKTVRFTATASEGATHDYGGFGYTDAKLKQKFKRSFRYTYEQAEELSIPRQLGLLDPASVLWEITPYSFVVDWFLPFGTYLSDLNQIPKLTGRWLVTNKLGTDGGVERTSGSGQSQNPPCGYHGGTHKYDTVSVWPSVSRRAAYYWRQPLGGPPPIPFPNLKSLAGAYSPRRLFNAISLAHQRFR